MMVVEPMIFLGRLNDNAKLRFSGHLLRAYLPRSDHHLSRGDFDCLSFFDPSIVSVTSAGVASRQWM